MAQFIPSSPVAPARWPSLVSSVGGEAAIRTFTAANAGVGGENRWEAGVEFRPGYMCELVNQPPISTAPCGTDVFSMDTPYQDELVTSMPLTYFQSARLSTFCSIEETKELARRRLAASLSRDLETELWTGAAHTDLGLEGQWLSQDAEDVGGGETFPLVPGLGYLQTAWGDCSAGARGMIHADPLLVSLWAATGLVRRESGLILDIFDNIVVAGTGYEPGRAYMTAVVDIHLSEVLERDVVDQTNNRDYALAYRVGLVKYEPCCVYYVSIDDTILCS